MPIFDTDAVSEVLKPKPAEDYVRWLRSIPADTQFVTSITIGELYWGAQRSAARDRHLRNIRERVVPALTVLPFDLAAAERFGEIKALLESRGLRLADADLQIAAIALVQDHELVTGNLAHFGRIPGLRLNTALAATRASP
jgi:predicted nucleic acid-binding protein